MELIGEIEKNKIMIMGILNVTPDSFSDGGKFYRRKDAVKKALELVEEGADIIDIGGESTRPGAERVKKKEELDRVLPVIEGLRKESDVPISIDTYKSRVAKNAIEAGADLVNDISALRFDEEMGKIAAEAGVPIVLMHMKGNPRTMQENPTYENIIEEIIEFLEERKRTAIKSGISEDKIIIDPGIGFGKTAAGNYEILKRLKEFKQINSPMLLGTSRKSFIGDTLNASVEERLAGTIATNVIGALRGADILRVHNVGEVKKAIKVTRKCM